MQEDWQQDLVALRAIAEVLDDQTPEGARRLAEVAICEAKYATWFGSGDAYLAEAAAAAERATRLAQTARDVALEAAGYMIWGHLICLSLGFGVGANAEAVPKLQQALVLARVAHCKYVETDALTTLGILCKLNWDCSAAWEYFEQALHLCREMDDRMGEGRAYRELGEVLFRQGDDVDAQHYAEQSAHICRETGHRPQEGLALALLSDISDVQGDHMKALAYAEQALSTFQEIKFRYGEGLALREMGRAHRKMGDYDRAKAYYEHALQFHSKEAAAEIFTLADFGTWYLDHGDYKVACEYLQQAICIMQDSHLPVQWEMWVALGHALIGLGNLSQAADAFQQALALEREVNQERKFGDALAGLARVALLQGDRDQALRYVEDILARPEGLDDPFRAYLICYCVLRTSDDARAGQVLSTAYEMLQAQAAKIADEVLRWSFLENVPVHREVVAEFEKAHQEK